MDENENIDSMVVVHHQTWVDYIFLFLLALGYGQRLVLVNEMWEEVMYPISRPGPQKSVHGILHPPSILSASWI